MEYQLVFMYVCIYMYRLEWYEMMYSLDVCLSPRSHPVMNSSILAVFRSERRVILKWNADPVCFDDPSDT